MKTSKIIYKCIVHKGERRIQVLFERNTVWNERIRKVNGSRWSKTLCSWHIPDNERNRSICGLPIIPDLKGTTEKTGDSGKIEKYEKPPVVSKKPMRNGNGLSAINLKEFRNYEQMLELKRYSRSTIKTYTNEFGQYLQILGNIPVNSLGTQKVKDYIYYCNKVLCLSENTIHSKINALKFYYEQVLRREKFFIEIPRPKKHLQLPKLLNEYELCRLFNALENKKHKAMLFTAYSAGLRVSELVNLKLTDIDAGRMQVLICRAKGKKDRYVNLSPILLDILRQYLRDYKPRPKVYLFESEQTFNQYPARTVQQIFYNAKLKAGIRKEIGIHSLRHSFATHLLDKGTDIKYIKELLGHYNIKTTERYLHVSKQKLVNITSPFDDLWKQKQIKW